MKINSYKEAFSYLLLVVVAPVLFATCGAGGDDSSDNPFINSLYMQGVFPPHQELRNFCASPSNENNWIRSWSFDTYFWYSELPDLPPDHTSDPEKYFDLMKTKAVRPSGRAKDRFHYTRPAEEGGAVTKQTTVVGYGINFFVNNNRIPREVTVSLVESNTASIAGIERGDKVIEVDGVNIQFANTKDSVNIINNALYPSREGETHRFNFIKPDSSVIRTTLTAARTEHTSVKQVRTINVGGEKVGYVLLNDFRRNSERQLFDAIEQLRDDDVTDLVLDLRYNAGGFLDIASQLSYMIAGQSLTNGKVFETLKFNEKYPDRNPITGSSSLDVAFHTTTRGYSPSLPRGMQLPTLDLSRVFVLTGPPTCSAGETLMNSLRGIDFEVIQIGDITCGKPYGFYPTSNCGTTYYTIQFQGLNNKGFGDYYEGFSPQNAPSTQPQVVKVAGCYIRGDDYTKQLGDPEERLLKAALDYREDSTCPPVSALATLETEEVSEDKDQAILIPNQNLGKFIVPTEFDQ